MMKCLEMLRLCPVLMGLRGLYILIYIYISSYNFMQKWRKNGVKIIKMA